MLHHVGALLDAIVNLIAFSLFASHYCSDVFHKIDAALFARAAFALFVFASGTFKTERGMAARTKSRNFARVSRTLRAFDHTLRNRLSVKGRSSSNSRAGRRSRSSARTGRRSRARLNRRGRGRDGSRFRRCIAGLTGRESSTHDHSLAGYPTQTLHRRKCAARR
jgi:hypothetical protein